MTTARETRFNMVYFPEKCIPEGEGAKGNIAYDLPAALYGKYITVHPDGSFTVSAKARYDDVAAFLALASRKKKFVNPRVLPALHKLVEEGDLNAVETHGYSHSPDELAFGWPIPPTM